MKKIILIILMMGFYPEQSLEKPKINELIKISEFNNAQFYPAYKNIRSWEGNYANAKFDKGGETYGGIARKFNKNWYAWRHIDAFKAENIKLKWNQKIDNAEIWVLDYYLDIWVKEEFYKIKNQETANYCLDFRVNGTIGSKLIQITLNDLGANIKVNNRIDSTTIYWINTIDNKTFIKRLKYNRVNFYNRIVKRDSTQNRFLKHWLKRANNEK